MGTAADQLGVHGLSDIVEGELSALRCELGVEDDLKQDVAQLLAQRIAHRSRADLLRDLFGLLREVSGQGLVVQGARPWAVLPQLGDGALQRGHVLHRYCQASRMKAESASRSSYPRKLASRALI